MKLSEALILRKDIQSRLDEMENRLCACALTQEGESPAEDPAALLAEAEIAALPLILLERKASSRLYLEKYFLQNGLRLNPEIELGARSLLVDLAAIGFGVAGVTEEFVRKELDSGRLKKLKTSFEIPARSVDMCLLSDVPQSAAAERFTDFVKDSLSKL